MPVGDLFDYLRERGGLPLAQAPFGPVDALILAALSYVQLDGPADFSAAVPLGEAAAGYLDSPEGGRRCEADLRLLRALSRAPRFASLPLTGCVQRTDRDRELQFGALTVLLEDDSPFLAFRGTDASLVGWKENLNMSFLDAVPAQLEAAEYARAAAARFPGPLRLGGHSKGGNLAIFAGVSCPAPARDRIRAIYNFDGPGFTGALLARPGYPELLSRTHTFVPQFSLVGMLLDREGPCAVVDSSQRGLLQHDPYSWQVEGESFVLREETSPLSRAAARAVRDWLSGLAPRDRERAADTLYALLASGQASRVEEVLRPQALPDILRAAGRLEDGALEHLALSLAGLVRAAARSPWSGSADSKGTEPPKGPAQ